MDGIGRLHQHGAVAVRVVRQDFIGNDIAGHHPTNDGCLHYRAFAGASTATGNVLQIGGHVLGTGFAKVPTHYPDQLLKVADESGVVIHLDAQILEHRHALGVRNRFYGPLDLGDTQACMCAVLSDRDVAKGLDDVTEACCIVGDPRLRIAFVLHQHGDHGGKQPRISAGLHPQMDVSHFCCFCNDRVDHDHGLGRILAEVLQKSARAGYAMRVPGVFAKEKRDIAVVEVALYHGPKHLAVYPEFTCFLLCQGAGAVNAAEH